jgi:aspartyl-tRNA(Asn)/glutamyl-tRNA(Gln) amidotransferase subunit A
MELHRLTIAQAAEKLRAREFSPVDLVSSVLGRIAETEDRIHAFALVRADSALREAENAERELARGRSRGPLHGIPIALKDVFMLAGEQTEAGSKLLKGHVPQQDATVVKRLRDNGAPILGTTVTTEFAYYAWPSDLPRTRNPWRLDHEPGDSSAGSGAAVASCSAMAAMGTDALGSVRKPASFCGVVGFKPTFGLVSRFGVISMSSTLDHCGPIAKSVADIAIVMNAISGYDRRDPSSLRVRPLRFAEESGLGVNGLRIGIDDALLYGASQSVRRHVEDAFEVLRDLGAETVPITIPLLDQALAAAGLILTVDAASFHEQWLRSRADMYEADTRLRLELGELVLATDYLRAFRVRTRFKEAMQHVFEENALAAIVLPTTLRPASPLEPSTGGAAGGVIDAEQTHVTWNRQCAVFNLTGQPALTVPCGFDGAGLPIGLQFVGRPLGDGSILRLGHAYERATEWHLHQPRL